MDKADAWVGSGASVEQANSRTGVLVQSDMKRFLFAFAPFALVTVAVVGVRAAENETERVSQTVRLDPGGTLHLRSFSGRVTITASDRTDVLIDAVRRAPRERLDHIKLDIRGAGEAVFIDANRRDSAWWRSRNNVVETDFDIKVPRQTNVDLSVFSAEVTLSGLDGRQNVSGFSSHIRLEDGTGSIKIHTFSGPVEIRAKEWRDGQNVDIDTFSGNVSLRVPESTRGFVTFNSFSGHLNSQLPLTLRDGGRRALKAELGANPSNGAGTLRFKTFSGSVQIDR